MRKKILLLFLVVTSIMGQVRAQNMGAATASACDSVVYKATFYFQSGVGDWIQVSDYKKMDRLLRWAKSDTTTLIVIIGWADKSGTETVNQKISLRRARTIRNYLVQKGIASERITFEGQSVDTQASDGNKARRADVCGVIRRAVEVEPPKTTPLVVLQPAIEVQPTTEQQPQPAVVESVQEQSVVVEMVVEPTSTKTHLRWYVGVGGGVSFGVSTLTSFAHSKTYIGWQSGVLGGYRISPLLSAEVGVTFGQLKLGSSKCCEDYFLGADGVCYLSHVAGMDSYSYKDIYNSISMQQYALRLNVDMLQIVNQDWNRRWSLTLSPAIYGINTIATFKQSGTNTTIIKRNGQFQFGVGAGVGVGCQVSENLGVGIRSSAVWVFGKPFDGIARTDHKENMIWNNTVTLTWRFGYNK